MRNLLILLALFLFSFAAATDSHAQYDDSHKVYLGGTWTPCSSMTVCAQAVLDHYCANNNPQGSYTCFDAQLTDSQVLQSGAWVSLDSAIFAALTLNTEYSFAVVYANQQASNIVAGNGYKLKRTGSLCEQGDGKFARYQYNYCAFGQCPGTRPATYYGFICYQGCKAVIETAGDFDFEMGGQYSYAQTGIMRGFNEPCPAGSSWPTVSLQSSFTTDRASLGGSTSGSGTGTGATNQTCGVEGKPSCESVQTQKETNLLDLVKTSNLPSMGGRGDAAADQKWFYFLDKAFVTGEGPACNIVNKLELPMPGFGEKKLKFDYGLQICTYAPYIQGFLYWAMWLITSAGAFFIVFRGTQ